MRQISVGVMTVGDAIWTFFSPAVSMRRTDTEMRAKTRVRAGCKLARARINQVSDKLSEGWVNMVLRQMK
jgi:hypothetical protein